MTALERDGRPVTGPRRRALPPPADPERDRLVPLPDPRRRHRLLLSTAAVQISAALAVAAVAAPGAAVRAAAVAAAAAVTGLWLGPDGRHLVERLAARRRLRRRRRRAAATALTGPDRRLGVLAALAPELRLHTVPGSPDPLGVGVDAHGWFAVLEVLPGPGLRGDEARPLDLRRLAQALVDHPTPPSAVQLVVHTVPPLAAAQPDGRAGDPAVPARQRPAARPDGRGGEPAVPARQRVWLAVRVGAEPLAGAGASLADIRLAVTAAAGWGGHALRRMGLAGQPLNRPDLVDALADSLGVPDGAALLAADGVAERWASCRVGAGVHLTCAVEWPAAAPETPLDALLSPLVTSTVAVVLRPEQGAVSVRCLVRYRAPQPQARQALRDALHRAARAGLRVRPMHGEQGPALYASAPTGGSAL
ncbi:hypothetical protein KZZ52_27875 [Dactylosporangium sp. AC04546]|uniref:hypothetical protein n=1 Tax=Dactylosporangium sp. AC04546 TaxID=2862460 RepID=UPI001EDEAD6C|nr:hypothetical protein [Dactylosporangium sp. AC04546]WVK89086.1 hypothetical protein KZZ52_27875 [Dactylosporangium sp. AC04546]